MSMLRRRLVESMGGLARKTLLGWRPSASLSGRLMEVAPP